MTRTYSRMEQHRELRGLRRSVGIPMSLICEQHTESEAGTAEGTEDPYTAWQVGAAGCHRDMTVSPKIHAPAAGAESFGMM